MSVSVVIGSKEFTNFNNAQISLRYDSIADTFSMDVEFNPNDAAHKAAFKPLSWQSCQIYYNYKDGRQTLLMNGVIVYHKFRDSPNGDYATISGYTPTAVFENCTNVELQPQFDGLSLAEIAQKLCAPFNIPVVIDDTVKNVCSQIVPVAVLEIDTPIKAYLQQLCTQKGVVLSHTRTGELLLTCPNVVKTSTVTVSRAVTIPPIGKYPTGVGFTNFIDNTTNKETPVNSIYDFNETNILNATLVTRGDEMHSSIYIYGQQSDRNTPFATVNNQYVPDFDPLVKKRLTYRPISHVMSSGNNTPDAVLCARHYLGEELKGIGLQIQIEGWELNGVLAQPNTIITMTNKNLYLYKKTRFFVEGVEYYSSEKGEYAVLSCVLPEVFNQLTPNNVFS